MKSSVKSSVKVLELIQKDNHITIPELATELSLSTRGIEKILKKLQAANRLTRIEPANGGYWQVNKWQGGKRWNRLLQ